MLEKIVSFGFKHEWPPETKPGVLVIDVRKMFRNPYRDRSLRYLNGLDPRVQADVMMTPNFQALYEHVKRQVTAPGIRVVYIGCTGGHHRSVTIAEKLATDLGVEVSS